MREDRRIYAVQPPPARPEEGTKEEESFAEEIREEKISKRPGFVNDKSHNADRPDKAPRNQRSRGPDLDLEEVAAVAEYSEDAAVVRRTKLYKFLALQLRALQSGGLVTFDGTIITFFTPSKFSVDFGQGPTEYYYLTKLPKGLESRLEKVKENDFATYYRFYGARVFQQKITTRYFTPGWYIKADSLPPLKSIEDLARELRQKNCREIVEKLAQEFSTGK